MKYVAGDIDHPEGISWSPRGYAVCGTEGGVVLGVDIYSGKTWIMGEPGGMLLGLAVDGEGTVFVCDATSGTVHRLGLDGSTAIMAPTGTFKVPNMLVLEDGGSMLVTDSGDMWLGASGRIVRVGPDGVTVLNEGLAFPNGMSFGPDRSKVYVVETFPPAVVSFSYQGPLSPLGAREMVYEFEATAVPDGVFVPDERVLVSLYRPDSIVDVSGGRLRTVANDPHGRFLAGPSNCCLAPDGSLLVANTAGRWITAIEDSNWMN